MCRSGGRLILFSFLLCYSVSATVSQQTKTSPDVATQQSNLKTSQLIDRLVDLGSQGIGFHSMAWAEGFMALDEDPEFRGGVLGSNKPEISPTMRELVRRGTKSLPDLLDHVNDARATKLVVEDKGFRFGAKWHSDEYDPRYSDPKKRPPGVNSAPHLSDKNVVEKYNLRVGDLCYVAIGQIVNRQLYALRYQPSACLVINSPVKTPSLAEAVRKDWSGLTAEAHRLSLTQDAMDPSPHAAPAALKRLCFYYPQAGEEMARKLLARPLYAPIAVRDFVIKRLVKERDPLKWGPLIEGFKKDEGPAAVEALPFWIYAINWESFLESNKEVLAAKDMARQILAKRFSHYNPLEPPFIHAMEPQQAGDLVRGLRCIRSAKIDTAVHELFRKATSFKAKGEIDRFWCDGLAMTCMTRLSGKGFDDEFRAFCKKRIQEIESTPVTSDQRSGLEDLRNRLKLLGG